MANEYAELSELRSMRGITDGNTDQDGDLQRALTRASRAIDDRTGRRFYADADASARTYRTAGRLAAADGRWLLVVDDIADTSITVELGDGTAWTAHTDYELDPENAIARGRAVTGLARASWPASRVRVTARWGWPAVPDPIAEATLLLANRRFMRRDSPEGVAGLAQEGPVRVSRFDPDIEDLVAPYVIPGFA